MTKEVKIRGGLPVHERTDSSPSSTSLRIDGLVFKCLDLTLADLQLMPQDELRADFNCREGWMVPDLCWRGVLLQSVRCSPKPKWNHSISGTRWPHAFS